MLADKGGDLLGDGGGVVGAEDITNVDVVIGVVFMGEVGCGDGGGGEPLEGVFDGGRGDDLVIGGVDGEGGGGDLVEVGVAD